MVKPLYSDAGSGVIFNLAGEIQIGPDVLPEGVILLPINKQAQNIVLPSGSKLAGIRFHPAIGYGVLGQHYQKPTLLLPEYDQLYDLDQIYSELRMQNNHDKQIDALYLWAQRNLTVPHLIPSSLKRVLECIEQEEALGQLNEHVALSQRQIERLFKRWLGVTPKHYQRILRIKKAVYFLRQHKKVNLADVSLQFGFSDQAHMTREFRAIASTTPAQI